MNDADIALLRKLGIEVTDLEYEPKTMMGNDPSPYTIRGEFIIDESTFRPMCRLIELTDMICESKHPVVSEQYHHLITLLNLTK